MKKCYGFLDRQFVISTTLLYQCCPWLAEAKVQYVQKVLTHFTYYLKWAKASWWTVQ